MRRPARAWAAGAAGLCLLLAAALALRGLRAPRAPGFGRVPDFSLTSAGELPPRDFSSRELEGRAWIADFIFTSCEGPCPLLSSHMARLQERLSKSVLLVSFTVDPERDGPGALHAYARRFGAHPRRWHFVTGPSRPLYRLLREGFKVSAVRDPEAPSGRRVTHSTKLVLVGPGLEVRGYYDGTDASELSRLERDAAALAR